MFLLRVLWLLAALSLRGTAHGALPLPAAWSQIRASALHSGFSNTSVGPIVAPNITRSFASIDGAPVQASPAVGGDGTVYYMGQDGTVAAVAFNGSVLWTFQMANPQTINSYSPALSTSGDLVVVTSGTTLCALSTGSGTALGCYESTFGAFTQAPTVSASWAVAVSASSVVVFNLSTISNATPAFASLGNGFPPATAASVTEEDPQFGLCCFYISSNNKGVKWCPMAQNGPVWTLSIGEPSTFAPLLVPAVDAVFFATNGPVGYIYGFAMTGSVVTTYCPGIRVLGSMASAPAWVGNDYFGLVAVSDDSSSASAVVVTGPGTRACIISKRLNGLSSSGSALAVDSAFTAYYGTSRPRIQASCGPRRFLEVPLPLSARRLSELAALLWGQLIATTTAT